MKNMNHQQGQSTVIDRYLQPMRWLLVAVATVVLQACASTTPELDAQWGMSLTEAKAAQSLPPSIQEANKDLSDSGKPTATESLRGLSLHNKSLPAAASITAK